MSSQSEQRIQALQEKVRESPENVRFQIALGREFLTGGSSADAEYIGQAAIRLAPKDQAAHLVLVESLLQQNKLIPANKAIDEALQLSGETVELLAKASEVRHVSGRLVGAEDFINRALVISSGNVRLRFQYAHLLLAMSRYADAMHTFKLLAEGQFFRDDALAGMAYASDRLGDLDSAKQHIASALDCSSAPSAFILQTFSDIAYQTGELDQAIDLLLCGIQKPSLSGSDISGLHFSLGKLLDKNGEYGMAFSHYANANALIAPQFDWRTLGERCQVLKQRFTAESMASMQPPLVSSDRLIFVIGLPRSGTSLVERVLASHSDVHGAGELEFIRLLSGEIDRETGVIHSGPAEIMGLGVQRIHELASGYVNQLLNINKNATRIIDKMPGNLMYLGLIGILFPNARIIRCTRNPIDTCLSCYFQNFHRSNSLAYTFSLDGLAYTLLEQDKLMQHWRSVLPNPIMDISYNEFVSDFDAVARQLTDFCDLGWDERMQEFYKFDNECDTASYEQVRRPIYKSSVNRWRNYAPYISGLLEQFPDECEEAVQ